MEREDGKGEGHEKENISDHEEETDRGIGEAKEKKGKEKGKEKKREGTAGKGRAGERLQFLLDSKHQQVHPEAFTYLQTHNLFGAKNLVCTCSVLPSILLCKNEFVWLRV